jgi:monolysocardiolipin acyltransferase
MAIRNRQLTAGSRLLSALAIGSVGIACNAFLNLGFCGSVRVRGLEILRNALEDEAEAANGRGLITGMYLRV